MKNPADRLDTLLQERFGREHAQPPAEPFLRETARRVASAHSRAVLVRRAAQGVALAALILTSPWLIRISALMSMQMDALLGAVTERLFTPMGAAIVFLLGTIGVVLAQARKIWRLD